MGLSATGLGGFELGSQMSQALRRLRRQPLWTASVCGLLALGMGANLAIFAVLRGVVLAPPPFPQGDRLVTLWETREGDNARPVAPANFLDWRAQSGSFEGLAALRFGRASWTGDGPAQMLQAGFVSGNLFELLRVPPALGRLFTLGDETGGRRLAVISDALWRKQMGAHPDAIGRTVVLGEQPYEIIGVLPAGFSFLRPADVWLVGGGGIPGGAPVPEGAPERDAHYLRVFGRLRTGIGLDAARSELRTIAGRLAATYPDTNANLGADVTSLQQTLAGEARPVLVAMQLGAGLLLLVALANVATLLLLRAVALAREVALRQALGARRGTLVTAALAEGLLLCGAGALGAAGTAWAAIRWLVHQAPAGLPRLVEIALDLPALAALGALALAAALLFGGAPFFQRVAPALVLRAATPGAGGGRAAGRLRSALTIAQLAFAFVLLAGTALLGASFAHLRSVDSGVRADGVLVAQLHLSDTKKRDAMLKNRFYDAVLAKLRTVPGVVSADLALTAPLDGAISRGFWIEGRPQRGPNQVEIVSFQTVSEGYFQTLGVPLFSGRAFVPADESGAQVAIVNRALAERYFPGEAALGKRIGFGRAGDAAQLRTIVGVVANVRDDGLAEPPAPTVYVPYAQNREPWNMAALLLRVPGDSGAGAVEGGGAVVPGDSGGDSGALAESVRRAILEVDPGQPVTRLQTLDQALQRELSPRRFSLMLAALFAVVALLVSALGTYAVLAFEAARRRREVGIRLALGARAQQVARGMLARGLRLAGFGIAAGWAATLALRALLLGLLYGVGPGDPRTLSAAAIVLLVVAALAGLAPALRSAAVPPGAALRED